jgi:hypothetical protein
MSAVPSWLPARLETLKATFEANLARMARGGFVPPAAMLAHIEHLEQQLLLSKQFMAAAEAVSAMAAMAADATLPLPAMAAEAMMAEAETADDEEAFEATVALDSLPTMEVEVDWEEGLANMVVAIESGRSSAAIAEAAEAERAAAIAEAERAAIAAKIVAAEKRGNFRLREKLLNLAEMAANEQERRDADARLAVIKQKIKAVEAIKTTAAPAAAPAATAGPAAPAAPAATATGTDSYMAGLFKAGLFLMPPSPEEMSPSPSSRSPSPEPSAASAASAASTFKVPKTTAKVPMKKKKRNTYKWA